MVESWRTRMAVYIELLIERDAEGTEPAKKGKKP
jgi:hypothetical protein